MPGGQVSAETIQFRICTRDTPRTTARAGSQDAGPIPVVDAAENAYFVTGALPRPGTVCQQERSPFAG
jgi:hypothetical protein